MSAIYSILIGTSLLLFGADDDNSKVATAPAEENPVVTKLKELGAKVVYQSLTTENDPRKSGPVRKIHYVRIDKSWKGDGEDLKVLKQFPNLSILVLVGRTTITEEQLGELKKELPKLEILRRASAYLGVVTSGFSIEKGAVCLIAKVPSDSPASKAGIKSGDIITKFDSRLIRDFDELIDEVSKKEPGDEVTLTIDRDKKSIEIKVKLESWKQQPQ